MIDPQFMDETLGIDRTKLNDRYKQVAQPDEAHGEMTPVEEQKPVPNLQFNMSYENGAEQSFNREEAQEQVQQTFTPVQPQQEEAPRPKLGRPGKQFGQDGPIFAGGPLESQVIAWKKQFGRIYSTEIDGEVFIWRTINRFEYKELMSVANTNELMREEMICETCVLFPYDYTYEAMVNGAGGVPSLLAEQIMQKSGFTRRAKITLL